MSVQNSHHFKNWQKLRLNYHIHFALHYQAINWGEGGGMAAFITKPKRNYQYVTIFHKIHHPNNLKPMKISIDH